MPSYTTSLRLLQPSTGEYPGSWGSEINTRMTSLVDAAVAGTTTVTMTAANVTLTNADGVADQAKSMFLVLQGSPGASFFVIVPTASKLYFVTNNTGFAQSVSTSGSGGISVPNGASMTLRCNGTNVVVAQNYFASMTLGAALPTASGGTGLTSFTANGVVYASSSSALATGSGLVFDGTNLGIGTSSPGVKLQVGDGTGLQQAVVSGGGYDLVLGASGGSIFGFASQAISTVFNTAAVPLGIGTNAAQPLIFGTTATERMRLDSSGNLGLGVTPSAWNAFWKNIQVTSASFGGSGAIANYATMASNIFSDGASYLSNAKYIASGTATAYIQNGGAHQWFTAPSGTAGNAISFTQAMTLDASGNLTMGSSNPSFNLGSSAVSTGNCALELGVGRTGSGNAYIDLTGDTTYTDFGLRIIRNNGGANTSSTINHRGTGELQLTCSEAAAIAFATNGTERARITSGGDFIVGSSIVSGPGGITMASITSGFALVNNNNSAATGYLFQSFRRSSTEIGSITQDGTTAVLYNTTSDRRLKDNITPAPSASDVIDAIEIVSHDWKAAPDEHVTYGVIAQDLALVAPQAVLQGDDGEKIEKTWGVDYSKLVPMLIKEIQSLRARVAALEQA